MTIVPNATITKPSFVKEQKAFFNFEYAFFLPYSEIVKRFRLEINFSSP